MRIYDKVYLIGNGRTAADCIRILHDRRRDAALLMVEKERFAYSQKFCERNGIPYLEPGRDRIRGFLMSVEEKTLIISAHNGYLFPRQVVEKDNLKIINLHIAPLPFYRGMNAPTWEIYERQESAGATWHEVNADIDAGGIIVERRFAIGKHETALQLLQRSYRMGVRLLEENVDRFLSGDYDLTFPTERTKLYLGKELPNGGYMDPGWDLEMKYAFLRSMDYRGTDIMPLPRVRRDGKIYEIWRYRMTDVKEELEEEPLMIKYDSGGYRLVCMLREAADRTQA